MNVLDVVFQYFEHRIPPSSPNPEEDVYNMRYRNRYFSLFPEDLNKDYNPYDFIEEPVEPRSFRKILTGLIGWTVIIPFILFLLLYQKKHRHPVGSSRGPTVTFDVGHQDKARFS